MIKKNDGITLIALVITIIILLILAGITISQLTGSGLFENAKLAEQKSKEAQEKENSILADYSNKIDSYVSDTTREPENEKEIKFYKGNNGFNITHGEMEFNSYGLKTTTFPTDDMDNDNWYVAECEKTQNATLGPEFEMSAQIFFENSSSAYLGGITISLLEEAESRLTIEIKDSWADSAHIQSWGSANGNVIANPKWTRYNGSGRYAIVGDGEKIHFYWGEILLGSVDYTENISYDKINIAFDKYSNYSVPSIYLESLYIGEPLYYKSMIQ